MVPRRGRLSGLGLIRGSGSLINRSTMMPGPIAVKLRLLREERGLTHKEAAELANVSHWTLYYLESGKRAPYMPTVTKIARAYGVSVEELVEEE
jgi:DNA-binding XRE family transcriptional regulator